MRSTTCLLAAALTGLFVGGNALGSPWFADNFDSYGTPPSADQSAFRAVWSWDATDYPGDIVYDPPNWLGDPFAWIMRPGYVNVRARRSLIPAIQAVDSSKNAVQPTAANPLIISYQTGLGSNTVTSDDRVVLWLELIGQEITTGSLDAAFASPIKNPGSYGTDLGECDELTSTCTAGWYKMIGKGCSRDSDCDTPMWLDFEPSATGTCTVLSQTLPLPRPSLAFGAYGGTNGLFPKAEPGNNCSSHSSLAITQMVTYDGDRWTRLTPNFPLGASAGSVSTSLRTTGVVLTIREIDYDITVTQPVTCDYAGRCDKDAMCISAEPGTCVNNVCTNNANACSTDAECNYCSDDTSQHCTNDGSCRSMTCEGGIYDGNSCTGDAECIDYVSGLVCMGGSTDGESCTAATNGTLSDTCGPKTVTKMHIPRQYTGPFQTIAMGPGHVFDGNNSNYYGSDYRGYIDSIELSGGEFVALPVGACCMPDGSCSPALGAACVQIVGAFYAGDNVPCESARCDAGACCTDQGCVADKTELECGALGGEFQGRGTNCNGGTCTGACCGPQGACVEAYVNTCGGDFRGINTSCAIVTPCCPSPYPDWDGDNDVDMDDFAFLQRCLTSGQPLAEPGCACVDHNHDGLINDVDVLSFIECETGPGIVPASVLPQCQP